jgi:F-type H+-transporting ATPase subunit alpha
MAMAMRPDEIVAVLRRQIEEFESKLELEDLGSVLMVGDGIARVYGLEKALAGELLEFPEGVFGMVLNLEEDNIGVVILGPYEHIKEGDPVKRTGTVVQVPVGEALIGRVVNPLGQPIDGKGPIKTAKSGPLRPKRLGLWTESVCTSRCKQV